VKFCLSTSKKISKLLPVALMGVGFSAAVSLPAVANDVVYHGNFCAANRSYINTIERTQWGVHNTSNGSTASVQCPFDLPFNASLRVNSVWATVYDRNPNANVSCTLTGVGLDGNTLWSRTSSSSGSGATHQFLSFSPPSTFIATMNMVCSIPPATSSGVSHVTTYRVITTP
jgi:hypothetical protein